MLHPPLGYGTNNYNALASSYSPGLPGVSLNKESFASVFSKGAPPSPPSPSGKPNGAHFHTVDAGLGGRIVPRGTKLIGTPPPTAARTNQPPIEFHVDARYDEPSGFSKHNNSLPASRTLIAPPPGTSGIGAVPSVTYMQSRALANDSAKRMAFATANCAWLSPLPSRCFFAATAARVRSLSLTPLTVGAHPPPGTPADNSMYQSLQSFVESDLAASQSAAKFAAPLPAAGRPTGRAPFSTGAPADIMVVPSNSERYPASYSPTSPQAAAHPNMPSAYQKIHSGLTTGKASPATSWEGGSGPGRMATDATDPGYDDYYMMPTSAASFGMPPPVMPAPPPDVDIMATSTSGTAFTWIRPTSSRFLEQVMEPTEARPPADLTMYESTARGELRRPNKYGRKGEVKILPKEGHHAGYTTSTGGGRVLP